MPKFKIDYSYYPDVKYDWLNVEAVDHIAAETQAEKLLAELDLVNPMIDTIEEIKELTING